MNESEQTTTIHPLNGIFNVKIDILFCSALDCGNFTYIVIIAGFLPNISC